MKPNEVPCTPGVGEPGFWIGCEKIEGGLGVAGLFAANGVPTDGFEKLNADASGGAPGDGVLSGVGGLEVDDFPVVDVDGVPAGLSTNGDGVGGGRPPNFGNSGGVFGRCP